ncbi:hypothetical protein Micbo1qcDRAFT_160891 [Microdochium bolleyi]|uniref:SKP1 component POZ domain-containing protein n=1 Tax=Microdochium bolleyi TaxID=196109 RepID=A0A136J7I2_9PEZI|nr:hypothetical protein Micbo1qcDRAFT_160891 [Microdochium bolleyi]
MLSKSSVVAVPLHRLADLPFGHAASAQPKSEKIDEARHARMLAIRRGYKTPAAYNEHRHTSRIEPPFHVGTPEEAQRFPPTAQRSIWLKSNDGYVYRVSPDLAKDSCLISDITGELCIGGMTVDMAIPLPSVNGQTLTLLFELLNGLLVSQRLEYASSSFYSTFMRYRRSLDGRSRSPLSRESPTRTSPRLASRVSKPAMRGRSSAAHGKRQTSPSKSDAMAKWLT